MQVKVLGCSGGIGKNLKTTSLLIDDDILLDCGTGVGELTLEEMKKLKHIFLTHSHLDHIAKQLATFHQEAERVKIAPDKQSIQADFADIEVIKDFVEKTIGKKEAKIIKDAISFSDAFSYIFRLFYYFPLCFAAV